MLFDSDLALEKWLDSPARGAYQNRERGITLTSMTAYGTCVHITGSGKANRRKSVRNGLRNRYQKAPIQGGGPGSGVISAGDSPLGYALPLMSPDPLRWKWRNGRQAGKTLDLVFGDRYRPRARRQGDGSLWRPCLYQMETVCRQRLPTPIRLGGLAADPA